MAKKPKKPEIIEAVPKGATVQAALWDGKNYAEIESWLGSHRVKPRRKQEQKRKFVVTQMALHVGASWATVNPPAYIVLHGTGMVDWETVEKFEELYDVLEPEEEPAE